jgi:hypothetical protein
VNSSFTFPGNPPVRLRGIAAEAGMSKSAVRRWVKIYRLPAPEAPRLGLRDRVQIAVFAYEHGIVRPGHGTAPADQKTRP